VERRRIGTREPLHEEEETGRNTMIASLPSVRNLSGATPQPVDRSST
jgi:hypothetical protein